MKTVEFKVTITYDESQSSEEGIEQCLEYILEAHELHAIVEPY